MAEWLVEEGIGEHRAALVDNGLILEAMAEDPDAPLPLGLVADAVVGAPVHGGRARLSLAGHDVLLQGSPGKPEGATIRVVVTREPIPEIGNPKPAKVRLADAAAVPSRPLPLAQRLLARGGRVVPLRPHDPDRLEAAGWSEVLEAARTGLLAFPGGLLRIALTPAMTVIDVDGALAPAPLALAGAEAAARAIRLFDVGGSIGIDLPTLGDKAGRQAAATIFDRLLPQPFERTAVNGFGFIQIVRPRQRPSLMERVQADPIGAAARALIRRAERVQPPGAARLVAAPAVIARLASRPAWLDELARRRGGAIGLREGHALSISGGHVETHREP